jgi:acyl-coenzyme A synthetase/AMP-(fatty) acid ligase
MGSASPRILVDAKLRKRPRSVLFIAEHEMPRTATGKIQHRVLRERIVAT